MRAITFILAIACLAPDVVAQQPDVGLSPLYGTATLSAGFVPDPFVAQVLAGGDSQNPISGTGCVGYLNMVQPDIGLNYAAGSYPLTISVESDTDTALLINQPDGTWVCDDDSGDGSNPLIRFTSPQSGNYIIWVATYHANTQAPATVRITELNAVGSSSSPYEPPDILYGTETREAAQARAREAAARAREAEARARMLEAPTREPASVVDTAARARAEASAREAAAQMAVVADLHRLEDLSPPSQNAAEALQVEGLTQVEVLYGTNRAPTGSAADLSKYYGNDRGTLSYGVVRVSIPAGKRPGRLSSQAWYRGLLDWSGKSDDRVVLRTITPMDRALWFYTLDVALDDSRSQSRIGEVVVFVHGFNNSFKEAAERTAQLAYDIGFTGAPVFYSWPSRDNVLAYAADEDTAEWATPHFMQFLNDISKHVGAGNVHVIAHSMGNRIVTRALAELADRQKGPVVNQVILAAPDISVDTFTEQIVPSIHGSARQITMYSSSRDRAIIASKVVHAAARAGESGDELVVVDGLETVDASTLDTSLIGHGYFAESKNVIDDIFMLLAHKVSASKRNLLARTKQSRLYWAFQ